MERHANGGKKKINTLPVESEAEDPGVDAEVDPEAVDVSHWRHKFTGEKAETKTRNLLFGAASTMVDGTEREEEDINAFDGVNRKAR